MATVNKASLRTEFDALKARFESLCAEGKMSPESRALVDALLMLFELLMAVFMEKHTPKSSANSSLPASQSPNDATARTRPGAKGKGPSYNEAQRQHPHPRARQGARRRLLRALRRRPHRQPAPVTRGAPSSTSCSRRSCVTPTPKSSTARAVTPRPGRASPTRSRTAPVRPRRQGLRRAPAHRADALAQTRRPIDARPHRPAPVRGDAPRLHRPTPSRARPVGAPSHRAPPRTTGDARRRDLVARGPKESLDSRLLRRNAHRQTPPSQTRVRGH